MSECDVQYVLGVFVNFKDDFDHLGRDEFFARLREANCLNIKLWANR